MSKNWFWYNREFDPHGDVKPRKSARMVNGVVHFPYTKAAFCGEKLTFFPTKEVTTEGTREGSRWREGSEIQDFQERLMETPYQPYEYTEESKEEKAKKKSLDKTLREVLRPELLQEVTEETDKTVRPTPGRTEIVINPQDSTLLDTSTPLITETESAMKILYPQYDRNEFIFGANEEKTRVIVRSFEKIITNRIKVFTSFTEYTESMRKVYNKAGGKGLGHFTVRTVFDPSGFTRFYASYLVLMYKTLRPIDAFMYTTEISGNLFPLMQVELQRLIEALSFAMETFDPFREEVDDVTGRLYYAALTLVCILLGANIGNDELDNLYRTLESEKNKYDFEYPLTSLYKMLTEKREQGDQAALNAFCQKLINDIIPNLIKILNGVSQVMIQIKDEVRIFKVRDFKKQYEGKFQDMNLPLWTINRRIVGFMNAWLRTSWTSENGRDIGIFIFNINENLIEESKKLHIALVEQNSEIAKRLTLGEGTDLSDDDDEDSDFEEDFMPKDVLVAESQRRIEKAIQDQARHLLKQRNSEKVLEAGKDRIYPI